MKIAHCIFTMRTGGAQVLVIDLLNEYCQQHETSLVIVNDQWNDFLLKKLDPRIKIYFINRPEGSYNPYFLIKLHFILKRIRPDVVHCHEDKMAKMFFPGFKTVFTIHDINTDINQIRKYSSAIAISTSVAEDVFKRIRLLPPVIHNGIAMENFRRRNDYNLLLDDTIRIVQISRLIHEKKGQDVLLRAVHELVYNRGIKNIHLDLIGSGDSLGYLISLAKSLHIDKHVDFAGEKDRGWIEQNLSGYHILAQPSRYEGFGLTIVEGVAAGLPVVASNIEGPAEIMQKADNHFLFEKENHLACADALLSIIRLYQENKIKAVMDQMYSAIGSDYSIKATAAKYLSVYKKLAVAELN